MNAGVHHFILETPPLPCVVDPEGRLGVFDAWSWCPSDVLEVRRASASASWGEPQIGGDNPPGLVFVMQKDIRPEIRPLCALLPRELARLHAFGYGLSDELALAPYAIDDATDLLHAYAYGHQLRPREVFWLAASSLDALVWGLHDWVHFHNHGPFDQPALTELQCDLVALAWLRTNSAALGIGTSQLDRVAADLAALSARRFADEGLPSPLEDLGPLFTAPYADAGRALAIGTIATRSDRSGKAAHAGRQRRGPGEGPP
jgi:hypothetical protein